MRAAKQFLTYTSPAAFQLAIARGLAYQPAAMGRLATELEARRDQLCDGLAALGYEVFRPAATYFATTDITPVAPGLSAQEFCLALPGAVRCRGHPELGLLRRRGPRSRPDARALGLLQRAGVLEDALARLASWAP